MKRGIVRLMFAAGAMSVFALASCSGDDGPAGPAGATGATGPAGATGAAGSTGPVEVEVFRATLTGANEVPAVTSTGTATATVTLVGGIISFKIDVGNLPNVTLAHIHGPSPAGGASAGVKMDFYVAPSPTISFTNTATLAAGVGIAKVITQDSLVVLLRNGQAYANVHTTANPGGELRGQLIKVP